MDCPNTCPMPKSGMLAFPHIIYQQWPEKIYDYPSGLNAGTIFPELNHPVALYEWGELFK